MKTVLWHHDADGFAAAFALWLIYNEQATYIPVQYGHPVPQLPPHTDELFIVDFSYPREECERLAGLFDVKIFDHHKTAEKELKGLPYARFNSEKSGCGMVWEHFHPDKPMPMLLQYVQDRDLWRFELENSTYVNLFIASLPFDFNIWGRFLNDKHFYGHALFAGSAIFGFRDGQVQSAVKNARMMRFTIEGGETYEVPVVNCSANISEVGHLLNEQYPAAPFSVSYCDRKDVRSWALRSRGEFDVSTVAKAMDGGGHKNAAGFTTDIGWPKYNPEEYVKKFEELAGPDSTVRMCCGGIEVEDGESCPVCGDKD